MRSFGFQEGCTFVKVFLAGALIEKFAKIWLCALAAHMHIGCATIVGGSVSVSGLSSHTHVFSRVQKHDTHYWSSVGPSGVSPTDHHIRTNAYEAADAMGQYYSNKSKSKSTEVPQSDVPQSLMPSESDSQRASDVPRRAGFRQTPKRTRRSAKLDEDPPAHAASAVPLPAPFPYFDLARFDEAKDFLGNTPGEDLFLCVVSQVFGIKFTTNPLQRAVVLPGFSQHINSIADATLHDPNQLLTVSNDYIDQDMRSQAMAFPRSLLVDFLVPMIRGNVLVSNLSLLLEFKPC